MPVLIASLVIGILFGVLLHRLFGKNSGNPEWQQEKEAMEEELRRYREQVNNHFSTSAELFQRLNDSYRDLLKHMADGTQELEVELPARLKHDINQIAALNNKPEQQEDDNISISRAQMAAQSTSPDSTVAASAMQTVLVSPDRTDRRWFNGRWARFSVLVVYHPIRYRFSPGLRYW